MVQISPNLKRTRIQVDSYGNEVKPFTREVILPAEVPYIPSPKELTSASSKAPPTAAELKQAREEIKSGKIEIPLVTTPSTNNPLAEMISKKVNEAVENALKNIDIGKMVEEAINKAFK